MIFLMKTLFADVPTHTLCNRELQQVIPVCGCSLEEPIWRATRTCEVYYPVKTATQTCVGRVSCPVIQQKILICLAK